MQKKINKNGLKKNIKIPKRKNSFVAYLMQYISSHPHTTRHTFAGIQYYLFYSMYFSNHITLQIYFFWHKTLSSSLFLLLIVCWLQCLFNRKFFHILFIFIFYWCYVFSAVTVQLTCTRVNIMWERRRWWCDDTD